jgi:drug/metabolite transporter (DMT)-like permease
MIFGSAFLYLKVILVEISAMEMVAARLFLGALTVFVFMAVTRRGPHMDGRVLAGAALLAVLDSVIPYSLIAWAEVHIDSGVASVLVSTMPMFTVAIAAVALPDERISVQGIAGLVVGLAGVIILSGGDVFEFSSSGGLAMLAVVGAAVSYAAGAVYARVLLRSNDPIRLTGTKLALAAPMALAIAFAVEGTPDYTPLSLEGSLALLALGVLSTGVAFLIYLWLVTRAGSVYASLVTYVVPVAGLFLGWAVLGEDIGPATVAGAALIAVGVAGVMHHPKQQPAQINPVQAPQLALRPREG